MTTVKFKFLHDRYKVVTVLWINDSVSCLKLESVKCWVSRKPSWPCPL